MVSQVVTLNWQKDFCLSRQNAGNIFLNLPAIPKCKDFQVDQEPISLHRFCQLTASIARWNLVKAKSILRCFLKILLNYKHALDIA